MENQPPELLRLLPALRAALEAAGPWLALGFILASLIATVVFWRHRQQRQQLSTGLAVCQDRLQQLERELSESRHKSEQQDQSLRQEIDRRARAEQQAQQIPRLEQLLLSRQEAIADLNESLGRVQAELADLRARREIENQAAAEKLQLLRDAEAQLGSQFENLANQILEQKSQRFSEQNRATLEGVLNPLRQQMGEFKQRVDDIHVSDHKDRAALREEIRHLRQQAQQINQDAVNLTRALKGDKKAQGNWGELILERVLEQSGLRKGIEYEVQGGFRDASDRLLKPDVIVRLPEGKDVIIDSKVSLNAYEAYSSAEQEALRETALKRHIEAVRNHIKSLSGKDYSSLKGLRSLDFVLLFMPVEAAFVAAFQHDDKLFNDAFEHKIVVVTPTTLLATLRTIENIWRYERQNENAKAIAERAGALYDKFRGLVDEMERLGKQLNALQNTYGSVMTKLTNGSGNLIRQANDLVELGVRVRKPLSKTILQQAGIENDEPDRPESSTPERQAGRSS